MSSVNRGPKNTEQGNAFFINIATLCGADFKDEKGVGYIGAGTGYANMSSVLRDADTANPGYMVVRDLGKTVRLSAPIATDASHNNQQRILRLVQRVDWGAATATDETGVAGANNGVGGELNKDINGYETFYIELSPTGSSSGKCVWARLAM